MSHQFLSVGITIYEDEIILTDYLVTTDKYLSGDTSIDIGCRVVVEIFGVFTQIGTECDELIGESF
jgi:hypothetical protein